MRRWLDYATQVSELEKMAKLSPKGAIERELPELLVPDPSRECLVCGKRPARACAACRSVDYCGVEHQRTDARWHDAVCDALRDIADDASERDELPPLPGTSSIRALAGWGDLFGAELSPARLRRLSSLATRPLTLARMLGELDLAQQKDSLAIHVMAASQRELDVPIEAWALAEQLTNTRLELVFVGPELPTSSVRARKAPYSRALWPELGRPDLIIGYDCGIMMYPSWKSTILDLRGSGVPFVITTYRDWEAAAEARLLAAVSVRCLRPPAPNPWASLSGKRSSTIANDLSFDNAFVSAWG